MTTILTTFVFTLQHCLRSKINNNNLKKRIINNKNNKTIKLYNISNTLILRYKRNIINI